MSHTPTPWKTNGYEGSLAKAVHSIDGKVLICAVEQPLLSSIQPDSQTAHDNAEFIVRAANAYDDLLEALKECVTANGAYAYASEDFYKAKQRLMAITNIAKAAIDKATS